MKADGNFKIGLNPKIIITHEDMEAIKHIVDIAPKEAQWFHRLDRVQTKTNIFYRIYGMYIPEQYCSSAEVESDPQMMYKFYKELKKEHGQEETNNIMSNLTVWCHSHHNMGVSPSGQDIKQFNENIENAEKAGQTNPQVMLIFNKKDKYHCKIYDPELNIILENVPMVIQPYDFSDLDRQAKEKFKKKPIVKGKGKTKTLYSKDWDKGWDFLDLGLEEDNYSSNSLMEDYINHGLSRYNSISTMIKKYYKKSKVKFLETLTNELTLSELQIFHQMVELDTSALLDFEVEEDYSVEDSFEDILNDLEMFDHDKETITAVLIFTKFIEDQPQNAASLIQEFDAVINNDYSFIESTYHL